MFNQLKELGSTSVVYNINIHGHVEESLDDNIFVQLVINFLKDLYKGGFLKKIVIFKF